MRGTMIMYHVASKGCITCFYVPCLCVFVCLCCKMYAALRYVSVEISLSAYVRLFVCVFACVVYIVETRLSRRHGVRRLNSRMLSKEGSHTYKPCLCEMCSLP